MTANEKIGGARVPDQSKSDHGFQVHVQVVDVPDVEARLRQLIALLLREGPCQERPIQGTHKDNNKRR